MPYGTKNHKRNGIDKSIDRISKVIPAAAGALTGIASVGDDITNVASYIPFLESAYYVLTGGSLRHRNLEKLAEKGLKALSGGNFDTAKLTDEEKKIFEWSNLLSNIAVPVKGASVGASKLASKLAPGAMEKISSSVKNIEKLAPQSVVDSVKKFAKLSDDSLLNRGAFGVGSKLISEKAASEFDQNTIGGRAALVLGTFSPLAAKKTINKAINNKNFKSLDPELVEAYKTSNVNPTLDSLLKSEDSHAQRIKRATANLIVSNPELKNAKKQENKDIGKLVTGGKTEGSIDLETPSKNILNDTLKFIKDSYDVPDAKRKEIAEYVKSLAPTQKSSSKYEPLIPNEYMTQKERAQTLVNSLKDVDNLNRTSNPSKNGNIYPRHTEKTLTELKTELATSPKDFNTFNSLLEAGSGSIPYDQYLNVIKNIRKSIYPETGETALNNGQVKRVNTSLNEDLKENLNRKKPGLGNDYIQTNEQYHKLFSQIPKSEIKKIRKTAEAGEADAINKVIKNDFENIRYDAEGNMLAKNDAGNRHIFEFSTPENKRKYSQEYLYEKGATPKGEFDTTKVGKRFHGEDKNIRESLSRSHKMANPSSPVDLETLIKMADAAAGYKEYGNPSGTGNANEINKNLNTFGKAAVNPFSPKSWKALGEMAGTAAVRKILSDKLFNKEGMDKLLENPSLLASMIMDTPTQARTSRSLSRLPKEEVDIEIEEEPSNFFNQNRIMPVHSGNNRR